MRDDTGSNYESDAAAHEFAHRPDTDHPSRSDLADQPADGVRTPYDMNPDELIRAVIALQRKWAS